MSGQLLVAPDRRRNQKAPFNTHWGTSAPSDAVGDNGDYYFHYGNSSETIYKKVGGTWTQPAGGGFSGWDSNNSEIFELSANTSSVVVTNFTLLAGSKLKVEKDGITLYEGYGITKNTGTNAIDFDDQILADSDSKVLVFVGKYS